MTTAQIITSEHPDYATGTRVRDRGSKTRGTVSLSTPTLVMVAWDTGWVGSYDGWQANNNLRNT